MRPEWAAITAARDEYRHVRATGTWLDDRVTRVAANTVYGPGSWILTPLRLADGSTILVNRGFMAQDARSQPAPAGAEATITGLLRMTEPGGALLRANDPAADRWFSRDVAAIAAARGLSDVAPYFIDADATPSEPDAPIGGLTVLAFPDNHLVYALTWYGMAAGLAFGAAHGLHRGDRDNQPSPAGGRGQGEGGATRRTTRPAA